jgi:2-dehydro-3-deoxy-D-arabinonate dehydratase
MPLARYRTASDQQPRLGLIDGDRILDVAAAGGPATLSAALQVPLDTLRQQLDAVRQANGRSDALGEVQLLAPLDTQEVWAAGVTYVRSRDARMEESSQKDVYDLVYDAERPEIFFKATPNRVSGPGEAVAIRGDSTWDVPEPELALLFNAAGDIAGYTVGNDVSSRSIEGANPLYLPQAKMYAHCAGLGPWIGMAWEVDNPRALPIKLVIRRNGTEHFAGDTSTDQIHRTFEDLSRFLWRHNEFPNGVFLMTGTGIIPPSEFTLEDGDEVEITIEGIGSLKNPVVRLSGA